MHDFPLLEETTLHITMPFAEQTLNEYEAHLPYSLLCPQWLFQALENGYSALFRRHHEKEVANLMRRLETSAGRHHRRAIRIYAVGRNHS